MRVWDVEKHVNSSTCLKGRRRRDFESKQDSQAEGEKVEITINGAVIKRERDFIIVNHYPLGQSVHLQSSGMYLCT